MVKSSRWRWWCMGQGGRFSRRVACRVADTVRFMIYNSGEPISARELVDDDEETSWRRWRFDWIRPRQHCCRCRCIRRACTIDSSPTPKPTLLTPHTTYRSLCPATRSKIVAGQLFPFVDKILHDRNNSCAPPLPATAKYERKFPLGLFPWHFYNLQWQTL